MNTVGTTSNKTRIALRYPRSFLILLLVGFAIVALPLMAGLISNAMSIERLSAQSQVAIFNATTATETARQLPTIVATMAVAAHSYALTGDALQLEAYKRSRESFASSLGEFAALPLPPDKRSSADALQEQEASIFSLLSESPRPPRLTLQVDERFADLLSRTESLNVLANQLIDQDVAALKASAAKSRKQVAWQLLTIIPSALLLIAGFIYLLARPIQDLAHAIHRLGEGKLAKRIRVAGPGDIEMLGEQLDWLRQRLISLEDQKTRFFQHVSHELKTPLAALREGSDLLGDEVLGTLNKEQREVARILKHHSLALEKLIHDLLTYSQAQSPARLEQRTALNLKPVAMHDLVDQVLNSQQLATAAKSITIQRALENVSTMGDVEKLRTVIDNLLSNAIKYSPIGGVITVIVSHERGQTVLDVIDQGPGVNASERERIFEPFYRSQNAVNATLRGNGLGLAIVREYLDWHQGAVTVLDREGAHFRVMLPAQGATEP
jgi:two-component system, NtrC family, sensor histidine kinase GlrK